MSSCMAWRCMRCLGTPGNFKWPGELIYIGIQVELAVCSREQLFCVGIGTSGASASVLPITHKLKLAVGFSDASAAKLAPIG